MPCYILFKNISENPFKQLIFCSQVTFIISETVAGSGPEDTATILFHV
jgi:hypothetical protein